MSLHIQHIAVNIASEEQLSEAEAFYTMLGGIPLKRPPVLEADTPGGWLGFGDTQLHLLVGKPLPEGAHFALHLGERYDEIVEAARKAGAFKRQARPMWGARRCFVTDPSGNLIELFESPPPSEPSGDLG
ncbi:MAG: VOC family protein [Actinomycetota bacterium]